MAKMMRHVGKLKSTDSRCIVVMMQIPNKEDHALIVESDSLPDFYHQNVMSVIESREAQNQTNLGEELSRKMMFIANRGNMSIMQALHEAGFLRAELVDNIVMVPTPGSAFPLRQILETMGTLKPLHDTVLDPKNNPNSPRFNPHEHNVKYSSSKEKLDAARGIIMQAQLMEADAAKLRAQAYGIAPELREEYAHAPALTKVDIMENVGDSGVINEAPVEEVKTQEKNAPARKPAAKQSPKTSSKTAAKPTAKKAPAKKVAE